MQKINLYSPGGVCTRTIYKWLHKNDVRLNLQGDVHNGWNEDCDKIIYLFGNPVNCVTSFYGKELKSNNFIVPHSHNMKCKVTPPRDIENYDKDYFEIENHFNKYFYKKTKTPYIKVNYKYMWEEADKILNFLEIDEPLPEQAGRSRKGWLKNETLENLNKIYEKLIIQIEDLRVITNE